jgi:hypothetical protein
MWARRTFYYNLAKAHRCERTQERNGSHASSRGETSLPERYTNPMLHPSVGLNDTGSLEALYTKHVVGLLFYYIHA